MKPIQLAAALAFAGFVSACSTTQFQSTWTAPEAKPLHFRGETVVAMVVVPTPGTRRSGDDSLAAQLVARGVRGVPAYTIIPDEDVKDRDKVKARLVAANAAGIVVMEVTRVSQQVTASPYLEPTYYGYYGGWDNWGWSMPAYNAGYIQTDTLVYVETLVYSLKQNRLVWAGKSETMNPDHVDSFIGELAHHVAKELKHAGLIQGE
jgi:hypothetical protein